MMRFRLGALLFAVALAGFAAPASAIPIVGGPGLDQGAICPTGSLCPGNTTWALTGDAAVTGSVTYNVGPSTVDITLTLTQTADFGGTVQFLAGTTFSATGIPVMSFPIGGGAIQVIQLGGATGSVSPFNLVAPGGSVISSTAAVSGLTCSLGTGADQCGISFGPGGLTIGTSSGNYDAFVTFNVNVPEPGSLALLGLGLSGLLAVSRRRSA